jgi:hypothetical protein
MQGRYTGFADFSKCLAETTLGPYSFQVFVDCAFTQERIQAAIAGARQDLVSEYDNDDDYDEDCSKSSTTLPLSICSPSLHNVPTPFESSSVKDRMRPKPSHILKGRRAVINVDSGQRRRPPLAKIPASLSSRAHNLVRLDTPYDCPSSDTVNGSDDDIHLTSIAEGSSGGKVTRAISRHLRKENAKPY